MAANIGIWSKVKSVFSSRRPPIQVAIPTTRGVARTIQIQPVATLKVSALAKRFDADPKGYLTKANSLLAKEVGQLTLGQTRLMAASGRPGALVEIGLDKPAAKPIVTVGDLHGNENNFNELLSVYGDALDRGEIKLVFLGDILHPERGDKSDMTSSFRLLKSVIMLKETYPDRVHFLLGNHDLVYTSPVILEVALAAHQADPKVDAVSLAIKYAHHPLIDSGGIDQSMFLTKPVGNAPIPIPQAIEFLLHLINQMKAEQMTYPQIKQRLELYQGFFDGCPLAVKWQGKAGNGLMAHTAAVRGGVTIDALINARADRGLVDQLLWNRFKKYGDKRESDKAYSEVDAVKTAINTGLRNRHDLNYRTTLVGGHEPNPDGITPIYQVFDPKTRLPAELRNVSSLVVHGNVKGFSALEVKVDGTVETENDIHAIYQAFVKAGGIA